MFVKICGITNEDDALLRRGHGRRCGRVRLRPVAAPDRRSSRSYDITRRLPPEILTVGVFRDEHPKRVIDIVHRAGVKAAQLHGHESPATVAEVARAGALGHQGVRRRLAADRRGRATSAPT